MFPKKAKKWDEKRTIIPNVAHILPPDIPPDTIHAFLLRFQLEEVEYRLDHIDEEADKQSQVKLRDVLIEERQQIIASIERIYPIFRPKTWKYMAAKLLLKEIQLPSHESIRELMGPKGTTLKHLEKGFNVKLAFRLSTCEPNNMPIVMIVGTNDAIEKCVKRIQSILDTSDIYFTDERPWNSTHETDVDLDLNLDVVSNLQPEIMNIMKFLNKYNGFDIGFKDVSSLITEPSPL